MNDKKIQLSEREISNAVFRLNNGNHAAADFELLKQLNPDAAKNSQFNFSPRRYHSFILRRLLSLTTEADIIAHRAQPAEAPTDATTDAPASPEAPQEPPSSEVPLQSESPSPKKNEKKKNTPE